ncbi:hypothetical protein SS45_24790 [Enterobacter hormaechei subsp. steigerwaltii]|nr:hypothetical protein SS45_24790 [Enterobacter hormaechei subsp. steigerwaltii]|tara:strand:+ start:4668 stop:4925 length:258 start_codon:yes stop_codon:yes gene_type:complete
MTGITTDISIDGLSLIARDPLPAGQVYVVAFEIPIGNALKKLNIGGKVTYCVLKGMEGYRIGMKFMLVPPETMEIVRRFFAEESG